MNINEELKKRVLKQLEWDNRIDASEIEVSIDNNEITLSGEVPNQISLTAAQQSIEQIPRVGSVVSNLTISGASAPRHAEEDAELEKWVSNSLRWHSNLGSYKLKVMANDGWVTLAGDVNTLWEKYQAEEKVSDIYGVTGVTNEITVVNNPDTDDETITRHIMGALKRSSDINIDNLEILVDNGNVTVNGIVSSQKAKTEAIRTVLYTSGVSSIDNRLVVDEQRGSFNHNERNSKPFEQYPDET